MRSSRHRILVVDDNRTNAVLLDTALRKAGYDVLVAADGFAAVDMAETQRPSLILLDMMMPDRDGLETCRILKAQETTAAIPIIFVTALSDSSSVVAALSAGGCDYVVKPFRVDEVLARLSVHLRLADAERDLSQKHAQLERLAGQLAAMNEQLAQQARFDPLTRLLHRGAWMECAELEHDRSQRHGATYAVIMIDLDHFKLLNDSQGHAAGDACLRTVADCIACGCRADDIVGRIGGEEFTVVCPETDASEALRIAEQLLSAIWDLAIPNPAAEAATRVTASMGVAASADRPFEATLHAADRALYMAKESGRNRVCTAEPSPADLPVSADTPALPAVQDEETGGDKSLVLIIDGDTREGTTCSRILARDGNRIVHTADGPSALREIRRESPDVVILDLATPGDDVLDFIRRLKNDPDSRDIPIVMVGARTSEREMLAGFEAGAEDFLPKPLRATELIFRVRSMVRLHRKQTELLRSYHVRGEQTLFLSTLLDLCHSLATISDLDVAFARVLQTTAELTSSRRIAILMPDAARHALSIASCVGIDSETAASIHVPLGKGIAGQVFESGQAAVINGPQESAHPQSVYEAAILSSAPLLCAPVGVGGKILGVLTVTERLGGRPFEPQETEYLDLLANIAGSAIHGIKSGLEREAARDAIVVALARLAEHRDTDTGLHVERVTRFCLVLAEELRTQSESCAQIDEEFLYNLERAAPLHDIGKVGIHDAILRKPTRLSPAETAVMQTHARIGAETIAVAIERAPGSAFLEMAREIALSHHEWFDGTGYPAGLAGESIPLSARIVAVADAYDALSSKRIYKSAIDHERCVAIIAESSGTHFDPAVVEAFLATEHEFKALARRLRDKSEAGVADHSATELSPVGGRPG